MNRRKRKRIRFFSLFVVFLMSFITFGGNLVEASAAGWTLTDKTRIDYTIIGMYNDKFTDTFYVRDEDDGTIYEGICAQPEYNSPKIGSTFTTEDWYYRDDVVTKIWFYGMGAGQSYGPLSGFTHEQATIIVHHAIAYYEGDPGWNMGDLYAIGGSSDWQYNKVFEMVSYAENHDMLPGWDAWARHLDCDNNINLAQDLIIYHEWELPKGRVQIHKVSTRPDITDGNACYSVEGAVYGLYSDSGCANLVDTITTDSAGYGRSCEHTAGTYYVREITAPKGFNISYEIRQVSIPSDDTIGIEMSDVPGTDPVTILLRKVNKETGSVSNGAGTLKGAKYVIKYYDTDMTTNPAASGKTPKYTYYVQTGADGRIRLRDSQCYIGGDALFKRDDGTVVFPLGTLTIQEYEAPEGYLLDNTSFVYNAYSRNYYVNGVKQTNTTSYQEADSTVIHLEQEIKGKVSIIKTKTVLKDDTTNVVDSSKKAELSETVKEEGAKFELYLKSAGSYANASNAVKCILTTDANGYAVSKDLPYGTYILHQIGGDEHCAYTKDMEVAVTAHGKTYELKANDPEEFSKIRLYKKGEVLAGYDEETGFKYEERFVGGCTYGIYTDESCEEDSLVEKVVTVDGGYVESAYEYKPGTYYVKEIEAADTFVLDETVYPVEVTDADIYKAVEVSNLTVADKRQKIEVSINKTDVDTKLPLEDTEFGIYAKEDILSYDGDVLVEKDTLLETITTDEEGKAESTLDYPNAAYYTKELKSTFGYGNLGEEQDVDATYKDSNKEKLEFNIDYTDVPTQIVKTTALDGISNSNKGTLTKNHTYKITDKVSTRGLIVGEEYTVKGILMDKATGKPLLDDDGEEIHGETTFVAQTPDDIIDVEFNFVSKKIQGVSTVVFEDIYYQDKLVYTHADIEDMSQTVTYPKTHVTIAKLDSTGIIKHLDGAKLVIYDDKGKIVYGPFITTDKPVTIDGLTVGDYVLHEIEAPAGFELAKDVKFTVGSTDKVLLVNMTDEAIIGYLDFSYDSTNDWNKAGEVAANEETVTVKTGDSNMMAIYAALMIISILGMILVAFKNGKKGIAKMFGIFAVIVAAGLVSGRTDAYAAESYQVTEKYTDKDANKEYDFDKTLEKDGITYKLSDVKYDAIEKKVPADVTSTLEMRSALTTYSDADFSETIEKDGITYKLAGVEKDAAGVADRTQYYEETVNYNEITGDKAVKDTITTIVTDPVTGKDYEVTLPLVSKKIVKSTVSDEFKFDITFYVTNGRYFKYKDNIVTYNENTPDMMQFSDDILSDLNLDPDLYKLNSIEWNGEAYKNDNGVLCRKATAVGNRVVNDYEVVYGGDYGLPADANAYQWVATYEATVNDPVGGTEYDITATATYSEELAGQVGANEEVVRKGGVVTFLGNHPVVFAGVSVLIVAAVVLIFIFFLRVRKSNKYSQE